MQYSAKVALHGIDLTVRPGEFVALLGPTGCGKTTLLKTIGGLLKPSSGSILLDGADITDVQPRFRNIGIVFQQYALFPHMTVANNVAFGLKTRRFKKHEIKGYVEEALTLVGLDRLADRKPAQLSGGQQQRVALARAIVVRPKVLLLDEPFGALDLRLRQEMQEEISRLQKRLSITTITVTHDQDEAFSIADRAVVMNEGVIIDEGSWEELHERPRHPFIASFIGDHTLIRISARAIVEGEAIRDLPGQTGPLVLPARSRSKESGMVLVIKANAIECRDQPYAGATKGTVVGRRFSGLTQFITVDVAGTTLRAVAPPSRPDVGASVYVRWEPSAVHVIEEDENQEPLPSEAAGSDDLLATDTPDVLAAKGN